MESQISVDVEILRFNPEVEAVRAFFNANGYALALDFFNHSLTDNPAPASLSLTGNTTGIYGHIRTLLTNDPFLNKMATFAGQSSMTQTIADYSHTFDSGDLYWSIHGFHCTRTRIAQGKASFAIDDVYDFDGIPGIVAGVTGTHDFNVHIDGLVEYGVIK